MSLTLGKISTVPCVDALPPPDARCDDPAFALANPNTCPQSPRLIVKPGAALVCALGSVSFRAFWIINGVELEVTENTVFSSSDLSLVVIGAVTGEATGISAGEVVISASYNGVLAQANLTVLAGEENCCGDRSVAMMVLVDQTDSMSQRWPAYGTKMAFARLAATTFINSINETKDSVGLAKFTAESATVLSVPTSDKAYVAGLVAGILQTQEETAFYDGMATAVAALLAVPADQRILVLISDGEDTTESYVSSPNPIELAESFRAEGGIVICLGVRAHGTGYSLLSAMATGGFFINAYGTQAQAAMALDYLAALKGYACGGACGPDGDEEVYQGALRYSGLTNWWLTDPNDGEVDDWTASADSAGCHVDLIGSGFFDYLPDNGLYLDLLGSQQADEPPNPHLVSKDSFALESGKEYKISLKLAGNQIRPDASAAVSFQLLKTSDGAPIVSQIQTVADYVRGFQTYSFAFTAAETTTVRLVIWQSGSSCLANPPVPPSATVSACSGLLLKSVELRNITDSDTLLADTFEENLQYVPPKCGVGTVYHDTGDLDEELNPIWGYSYGYNCYGTDCLDTPPPSQAQDPDPLPVLEGGFTDSGAFTATAAACDHCPKDFINIGTPLSAGAVETGVDYRTAVVLAAASKIKFWEITFNRNWSALPPDDSALVADKTPLAGSDILVTTIRFSESHTITSFKVTFLRDYIEDIDSQVSCFVPDSAILQGSNDGSAWETIGGFTNDRFGIKDDEVTVDLPSESDHFTYFRTVLSTCHGEAGTDSGAILDLDVYGAEPASLILHGSNNNSVWSVVDYRASVVSGSDGLKMAFLLENESAAFRYYRAGFTGGSGIGSGKVLSLSIYPAAAPLVCKEGEGVGATYQEAFNNAFRAALTAAQDALDCRRVWIGYATKQSACPDHPEIIKTASASAVSIISQGDADAEAEAKAILAARAMC